MRIGVITYLVLFLYMVTLGVEFATAKSLASTSGSGSLKNPKYNVGPSDDTYPIKISPDEKTDEDEDDEDENADVPWERLDDANIKTRDHAQHQPKESSGSSLSENHDLSGSGDSPVNHQYHDDDTYDVQTEPDDDDSNPNIDNSPESEEETDENEEDADNPNIPWQRLDDAASKANAKTANLVRQKSKHACGGKKGFQKNCQGNNTKQ